MYPLFFSCWYHYFYENERTSQARIIWKAGTYSAGARPFAIKTCRRRLTDIFVLNVLHSNIKSCCFWYMVHYSFWSIYWLKHKSRDQPWQSILFVKLKKKEKIVCGVLLHNTISKPSWWHLAILSIHFSIWCNYI